jgi:hypothetical protein
MARRPVVAPPPKLPKIKKPGGKVILDRSEKRPQSLPAMVEDLVKQSDALQLSVMGHTHQEIADKLNVSKASVAGLLNEGLGELLEKRDKAADKFFSIHRRRYDLMIREWMPKAMDRIIQIKNDEGAFVDHFVPGDPKAAMIVAKLQADYAKMFGLNKMRVEHTGAHGGPILNMNIDWSRATDEQLAQAAAGNSEVVRQLSERNGPGAGSSAIGTSSSTDEEG